MSAIDEAKLHEFMGKLVTDMGGAALTANVLIGKARLRKVFTEAGFTRFHRAAGTPFNLILEACK